jgi:hypothetical protein
MVRKSGAWDYQGIVLMVAERAPEPHSPLHASPTFQRRFMIIRKDKGLRQAQ